MRALLAAADPVALAEEIVRRGLNVCATERLVQRRAETPPTKRRPPDADTLALERELSAVLGLRVTLKVKKLGGTLTLHYASLDSSTARCVCCATVEHDRRLIRICDSEEFPLLFDC